jgi:hypothetical protein
MDDEADPAEDAEATIDAGGHVVGETEDGTPEIEGPNSK